MFILNVWERSHYYDSCHRHWTKWYHMGWVEYFRNRDFQTGEFQTKHWLSDRCVGGNALLIRAKRKAGRLGWAARKDVVSHVITHIMTMVSRQAFRHTENTKHWGGCATTAQDHIRIHLCQQCAGMSGCVALVWTTAIISPNTIRLSGYYYS